MLVVRLLGMLEGDWRTIDLEGLARRRGDELAVHEADILLEERRVFELESAMSATVRPGSMYDDMDELALVGQQQTRASPPSTRTYSTYLGSRRRHCRCSSCEYVRCRDYSRSEA